MADHPEGSCDGCGGKNVVWFAPSAVWNEIAENRYGILCPPCFAERYEAAKGRPPVFRLEGATTMGMSKPSPYSSFPMTRADLDGLKEMGVLLQAERWEAELLMREDMCRRHGLDVELAPQLVGETREHLEADAAARAAIASMSR